MTDEQAQWLRAHPEYEVVGVQGIGTGTSTMDAHGSGLLMGSNNHDRAGALRADGTFHPREKVVPPAILVGVRKAAPAIQGGPIRG